MDKKNSLTDPPVGILLNVRRFMFCLSNNMKKQCPFYINMQNVHTQTYTDRETDRQIHTYTHTYIHTYMDISVAKWLAWLTSNCGRIGAIGSSPSNG